MADKLTKTPPKPPEAVSAGGYGKPPVSGQFKPGVSGNPKGRPKSSPTIHELVMREARRLVTLKKTVGGSERAPQLAVLIRRVFHMALNGHLGAARFIAQLLAPPDLPSDQQGLDPIADASLDDAAVSRMLQRLSVLNSDGDDA